ncbi:MAG: DsrE/DsrF/DrsH-like family protein [Desulfobacterales bacterium]|jgi:peroxiredoxin family protein
MDMQNIENQFAELKSQLEALDKKTAEDKLSMVVFSGDLDKIIAAFVIATGAVAMGMDAVMFFTFWGTPVLRDAKKRVGGKDTFGKMFGTMLPKGMGQVKLSKMNMGGMGTAMMKSLMKKKNVASLEQFLEMAEELGVRIFICEMTMDLMGFKREEMIDYKNLTFCGVAKFLEEAANSKVQLFI